MVDQPRAISVTGVAQLAVAETGTLAYLPSDGESRLCSLEFIDDAGAERPLGLDPRLFRNLRVDRRGERLAATILDGARSDVWTTSLASPNLSRLTFSGFNIEPRWSPDGAWIVFASNRDGPFNIYRKPAGGDGAAERLAVSELHQYPGSFTPDGRRLLFNQTHPATGFDIWIMDLDDGGRSATPLIDSPANEFMPTLSPDGRWMAYLSDETGRWEAYVRPITGDGGVRQVSGEGAGDVFWSADGTKLYFGRKMRLYSVPVTFGDGIAFGPATPLPWPDDLGVVDSLPDGRRFIAIKELVERPRIDAVRVVVNPD